jgi:ADP-ribose pyrophosphatase
MTRRVVFRGRKIQVALDSETLADGSVVERDVVVHPGAVAILPLVDPDHVCLVRNRRPIVGEELLEVPAGTLEPGEAPDAAAVRELAEETGYRAASWRKLAEFFPSPGVLSERTHLYLASELTAGRMQLEAGEELEPQVVDWSDAMRWAMDGSIRDAKTLIALLLFARLRLSLLPGESGPTENREGAKNAKQK